MELNIMTKLKVLKKFWPNSKYWKSSDQKIDALSSCILAKSVVKIGQLQMRLYQAFQAQIKKLLSLDCIPRSLVFNATNGVQKIQVTKKLRPFYCEACSVIRKTSVDRSLNSKRLYYYSNGKIWYFGYKYNPWGC